MRRIGLALFGITLAATTGPAAPALKDKSDDAARIVGQWSQESLSVRGGEPTPTPTRQPGSFRFSSDGTCGITSGGRENPAEYALDVSKSPRRMKWLNGAQKTEWLCLYELDGDTLKVAFVDQGSEPPNKIEPTKNLTIYYLKRIKD